MNYSDEELKIFSRQFILKVFTEEKINLLKNNWRANKLIVKIYFRANKITSIKCSSCKNREGNKKKLFLKYKIRKGKKIIQ